MAVGFTPGKTEVDATAATLVRHLDAAFLRVQQFKDWLDTQADVDLTALGYDATDVAVLKSAFTDLANLRAVYLGQREQIGASDFRAFARRLVAYGF